LIITGYVCKMCSIIMVHNSFGLNLGDDDK